MNRHAPPAEFHPAAPVKLRSWLTDTHRAELARQFDCALGEVEAHLEARAAMDAEISERREYADPFGYDRERY